MNLKSFEVVEDADRRFQLMEAPKEWHHNIPEGLLKDADDDTRERYIIMAILSKQLDWLIQNHVSMNNNLYHAETEWIRGRQFRKLLVLGAAIIMVGWQIFGGVIKEKLSPPGKPGPTATQPVKGP